MGNQESKEGYATIEALKAKFGTSDAVFSGAKMANGWKAGRVMTEKDYQEAVKAFEKAPMDGRGKRDV